MNFIDFLKKNKDTRKVFGQRELKIMEKQLWGVSLSQSEKNRLSRDIRKKLSFVKEAIRFEFQFALRKGSLAWALLEEVQQIILRDILASRIQKIQLFGSFVEGKFSLLSDIDVAVKFLPSLSTGEATQFRKRILGRVPEKVDIQVYDVLPRKIQKEIDQKGRLLYGREDK